MFLRTVLWFTFWLLILSSTIEALGSGREIENEYFDTTSNDLCNQTIELESGDSGYISSPNYPSAYPANTMCEYTLSVPDNSQRIKITFHSVFDIEENSDCSEDYLHIGNNMNFRNMKSLTSYKFCGQQPPLEIVSRRNEMWLVFKSNSYGFNKGFLLNYRVLPEVLCENSTDLSCSAVQCVGREKVCDGHADCTNGFDEYCGFRSPTSESCFLCKDYSCVLPRQPLNSMEYGKKWWWLCDEWAHCADGTDERMDICLPLKGRSQAIFECQADRSIHLNHSIALLHTFLCDGVQHCLNGEDENHIKCRRNRGDSSFDKKIILFPVLAIVIFSIFMIFVYNLGKCRRALHLPRSVSMSKRRYRMPSDAPSLIEGHHKSFSPNFPGSMGESPTSHSGTDSKQTFV